MIYFWLRSPDLAAQRVTSGGHSIPEDVIRRRYSLCRKNLIKLYLPLSDGWMIFDNSEPDLQLVAKCIINQEPSIYNQEIWSQIVGEQMPEGEMRAIHQVGIEFSWRGQLNDGQPYIESWRCILKPSGASYVFD